MNKLRATIPDLSLKGNETDGFLTDSNNILNRSKKYFCQLLNINESGINVVRLTQLHMSLDL
jgi:hypothetical protein